MLYCSVSLPQRFYWWAGELFLFCLKPELKTQLLLIKYIKSQVYQLYKDHEMTKLVNLSSVKVMKVLKVKRRTAMILALRTTVLASQFRTRAIIFFKAIIHILQKDILKPRIKMYSEKLS